jgi:hypothetical protein
LTTIAGRAQVPARLVRRSSSVSEEERVRILAGLVAINGAVEHLVVVINAMMPDGPDRQDPTQTRSAPNGGGR